MNAPPPTKAAIRLCLLTGLLLISYITSASDEVDIKLANQTEREQRTEQQLRRLLTDYDLSRWTFSRSVLIDEKEIPHSHPVLTLHTRHMKDDELLLSTYVHEQLHWFLAQHPTQAMAAARDLQRIYPNIPVGYPEGASDKASNYEHMLVVYLEYRANQILLGELKAREVMAFWSEDHYTWIYKEILKHPKKVGQVLKARRLDPG
ncbi:hypothetical protein GCM10027277_56730 [Pseudoduganella ginsengisoli]|uniref:Uncharacterized protein n=1 Tax=Pseudoduganella ginsengisoli TaxID=1462440 RepID=A0A6L6Q3E2_9BURK|nr:hypothetical protein [Pseudoduganella ginsengisoli]MTW03954.1 hypothetical protein [Pseudoduganella ginsengisoli]